MLTKKQTAVLNAFRDGHNIFMTGPGGCGKSFLINEMVEIANAQKRKCSVTATTGCAAVLLGNNAKTINSWGGIGIANKEIEDIVRQVNVSTKKRKAWKESDILIIDEVSMLSKKIFETLDAVGRKVRKNNVPFGGIQVVFSGDFYQLPPVGGGSGSPDDAAFCFESDAWNETFKDHQICLTRIFRQDGDETFKKILQEVRKGSISEASNEILMTCVDKVVKSTSVQPVKLFPRKNVVDSINAKHNAKLKGQSREYGLRLFECRNTFRKEVKEMKEIETIVRSSGYQHQGLSLKIGSQVMCVVNMDMESEDKICNGSCGIVVDFTDDCPVVKFNNGRVMDIAPFPRRFEHEGRAYEYETTPLILSWAMTIHKCQGMSLDIAEIDIGSGIFESGQTYVALSRVKSLEGLYLTSFDSKKIKVRPNVKKFYALLNDSEGGTETKPKV